MNRETHQTEQKFVELQQVKDKMLSMLDEFHFEVFHKK